MIVVLYLHIRVLAENKGASEEKERHSGYFSVCAFADRSCGMFQKPESNVKADLQNYLLKQDENLNYWVVDSVKFMTCDNGRDGKEDPAASRGILVKMSFSGKMVEEWAFVAAVKGFIFDSVER